MRLALVMGVLGLLARVASAQELKNDGFGNGQQVVFQGGFSEGEVGAVRLTPPGRALLSRVSFLFGGATTTQFVTVRIWDDRDGTDIPGQQLYEGDYEITGANDASQQIDLLGESIIVDGPFRVGVEFTHTGFPGLAIDGDMSIAADRNFIGGPRDGDASTRSWRRATSFGLTGDFIIRATVQPFGGPGDASVRDAGRDGGADGAVDGGSGDGGDGGCGCRAGGRDHGPAGAGVMAALLTLAALGLALARRRRRVL